jgi:enterochelin esterase-like enzyme
MKTLHSMLTAAITLVTLPLYAQNAAAWKPHPDAVRREDVPHGTVEQMPPWQSKIFENTTRDWAIYVPAQYKKEEPAALMVFQDGRGYQDVNGRWRVPVVFDNLIARGDMPPTIAVFINPGHDKSKENPKRPGQASNRSFEYDSLGDRYARFLLEEIIPEVEKRYNVSNDPEMRAICGASSGGICSFTVAWERPDAFRKLYQSARRQCLSVAHPQDGAEAAAGLSGRYERRPRQSVRQLAAVEQADGVGPAVHGL